MPDQPPAPKRPVGQRARAAIRKLRHALSDFLSPANDQPWAPDGQLVPIPVRITDRHPRNPQ